MNPACERSRHFQIDPLSILYQLDRGKELQKAGRYAEAEEIYRHILNYDYNDKNALFLLATLYQQNGSEGLSINLFKRLLTMAPEVASVHNNLGAAYHVGIYGAEAEYEYQTANRMMQGKDPDVLGNLGGLSVNTGHPELGLHWFDQALALEPEHPNARWNRSLCLLELERFEEGFRDYEYGLKTADRKYKHYILENGQEVPEWDGTHCDTLIVCGEQGIGDEIMFGSLLWEVSGYCKTLLLDCHPRLGELFACHIARDRCEWVIVPTRKETNLSWLKDWKPDFRVNIGSLGKWFRPDKASFLLSSTRKGYLKLPEDAVERVRQSLREAFGDRFFVGLTWQGGGRKTRSDLRSIPLQKWLPLLRQKGVTFICLQYKQDPVELEHFEHEFGARVEWIQADDDFYAHALLTAACDLRIGINNTTAHLCGALGIPAWILTPTAVAWRYGLRDPEMVWYESVRLLRQKKMDEWGPLLAEVSRNLEEILAIMDPANQEVL